MPSRKEQVYTKVIKDFVKRYGRVPTEGELHQIARGSLYVPTTTPTVPKDKAISNPDHFKNTLQGLIDDDYDIMELIEIQKDYINQLRMAIEARNTDAADKIRASINRVRFQETLEDSKIAVANILPEPILALSNNIVHSASSVAIQSDNSYPIGINIIDIVPFTDKPTKRYQLEKEFAFPYVAVVEGEKGSNFSGVQFQLLLDEASFITRLHYEGSPAFITIEVLKEDEPEWTKVVSMNITGQDDIAISTEATRMRITLTQELERCSIKITDLRLFQERYNPTGTYVTAPIKLDNNGVLDFDFDQYIPEGTTISWQYAIDIPVSGEYTDTHGDPVYLDSPAFGIADYSYASENNPLTYAQTVGYDLEESFQRPIWKSLGDDVMYNIESGNLPEFSGTVIEGNNFAPLIDVAVIPDTALDNTVSVSYGKDAWLFRTGELERAVIDEVGLRRLAMTGYPHWTTHLLVKNDFQLNIYDPDERIAYVILELEGNVLILERPFQYTLVKGIWKCTLVMDEEYLIDKEDDLSETTAIVYSGLDPRTAVNTEDSSGATLQFYIQPFPIPIFAPQRMRTDPDYTDYQRAAVELRNDGTKHIIVPDMSTDPSSMGIVSTTITIDFLEDIYKATNIPLFYDITYIKKVDSSVDYVFLRAELSTSNKELTPIIRGVSLALNKVKREAPPLIKRLKREGAPNPLPG